MFKTSLPARRDSASKPVPSHAPQHPVVVFLQNSARLLALAIVAFGPWYYGSASWNAQLVCVVASIVVAIIAVTTTWSDRTMRLATPHYCVAAVIVFALLQTIPLPDPLWTLLSPNADFKQRVEEVAEPFLTETKSEVPKDQEGRQGESSPIVSYPRSVSIFAKHTRVSATVLSAALAMMVSGTLLFNTNAWKYGALLTMACVGIANAIVGLLQSVAWNDWTLLENFNGKNSFATFVNRNSVAQYYSIALGSSLALLVAWFRRRNGNTTDKRYHVRYPAVNLLARARRRLEELITEIDIASILLLLTICLLFVSVLAAASRGGILACSLAILISVIKLLGKRASVVPISIAVTLVGVGTMLLLSSFELDEQVSTRLGTVSEELHQLSNVRLQLWAEVLSLSKYWLLGSGFGTFHLAVLECPLEGTRYWFYHAENIYVETFVTTGVFGLVCLITCVAWLLIVLFFDPNHRKSPVRIACLLPVIAIVIQSLVDFSLILPAISLPLCLLVGILCGERIESNQKIYRSKRKVSPDRLSQRRPNGISKFALLAPAGSLALILFSAFNGLVILADFGKAESLARMASEARTSPTIDTTYEVARQQQRKFQMGFQHMDWPQNLSEDEVSALARPEMTVAAILSKSTELDSLVALLKQDPRLLPLLKATHANMVETATNCPQDWRANWGLLRSSLDPRAGRERTLAACRILCTSNRKPELLRTLGTYFFWIQKRALGRRFWKAALRESPRFDASFYALANKFLSPEDLKAILPDDVLTKLVAVRGMASSKMVDQAVDLSGGLPKQRLIESASSVTDWQNISWLGDFVGDSKLQVTAYARLTKLAPMEPEYSFKLASMLAKEGDFEAALQEIQHAVRISPNNKTYRELLDSLLQQESSATQSP